MSRNTFLKGALILTAAGIMVKIIGSVNRILLSRFLGGEGIGLYQMAYPIYLLAVSISSAGIPVAISIIVAEKIALSDYRGANRVFKISLAVLTVTGLIFTFLLYFGAGWLIEHHFVRDARAYYAIAALAPAIFFVTVLSSYRGYFQGFQMMTPTAVSQIAEQFVRVVTMIAFAYLLMPKGLEFAAAGASFGAGPGAVAGLLVLIIFYWYHRPQLKHNMTLQAPDVIQESGVSIITRIVQLALPVSLANIMLPVVSNIDLLVVPARLEVAGFSVEQATELFGYLTGMAVPLVNMSTIPTVSLAASLVPAISETFTLGDHEGTYSKTATAMRLTNLITIPSFAGMCVLATPISQMLYGTANAGVSIAIMSGGIVLLGMQQVTTGILQGLGHTAIPVANMVTSALVKIGLAWTLTAIPAWGIKGAAWASIGDFGIAAILNIYFIHKYIGFSLDIKDTMRTITASAVMAGVVLLTYNGLISHALRNTPATMLSIMVGGTVYVVALLLVGGVVAGDLARIPRIGAPAVKYLSKFGLLRR